MKRPLSEAPPPPDGPPLRAVVDGEQPESVKEYFRKRNTLLPAGSLCYVDLMCYFFGHKWPAGYERYAWAERAAGIQCERCNVALIRPLPAPPPPPSSSRVTVAIRCEWCGEFVPTGGRSLPYVPEHACEPRDRWTRILIHAEKFLADGMNPATAFDRAEEFERIAASRRAGHMAKEPA